MAGKAPVESADIATLRTFDMVRPHPHCNRYFHKRGVVLVLLPGEPGRVIVKWKAGTRVELVRDLVVTKRAK